MGQLASAIGNDIWNRPVANGECRYRNRKGYWVNRCKDEQEQEFLWKQLAGAIGNDIWNRPVANGECRYRNRKGYWVNRCREELAEMEFNSLKDLMDFEEDLGYWSFTN